MQTPAEIILTAANAKDWPAYERLLNEGKVIPDALGRLRYVHGAPVGKMVLVRVDVDGTAKYRESADEWFDPDSKKAREFVWPK